MPAVRASPRIEYRWFGSVEQRSASLDFVPDAAYDGMKATYFRAASTERSDGHHHRRNRTEPKPLKGLRIARFFDTSLPAPPVWCDPGRAGAPTGPFEHRCFRTRRT